MTPQNSADFCLLGIPAPPVDEPAPMPTRLRATRQRQEPRHLPEPQYAEEIDGLHRQTLALAALVADSQVDARALLANLRTAIESVKAGLPSGQQRTHGDTGQQRYLQTPTGRKTVTVDGEVFASLARAARVILDTCLPGRSPSRTKRQQPKL